MSERVRVAGIEYLILSIGYSAYIVGSLLLIESRSYRLLPAAFFSVTLIIFSIRTPWACRVEPTQMTLRFGPAGLLRKTIPRERVTVRIEARNDWGRTTREVRVLADQGLLALLGPSTIANARFGVAKDHGDRLLDEFRALGYRIEDHTSSGEA